MLKSFLEYIFESESKLSLPIYYSKRLKEFIYKIEMSSKDPDVSKLANAIRFSEDSNQMSSDITLIDMTDKNDMLSFIQVNRVKRKYDDLNKINPDLNSDFKSWVKSAWKYNYLGRSIIYTEPFNSLWKDQRSEVKVGKFSKKIFKDNNISVTDAAIEKFSNAYKATFDFDFNLDQRMDLVSGEDIRKWYLQSNYSEVKGQLGNSCMRHNTSQSFFNIYVENPEVCNLLIMYSDQSKTKICGRALVWTDINGNKLMDRVYTINDYDVVVFRSYASSKNWISNLGRESSVKLNKFKFNQYPYMDSFMILDTNNGTLQTNENLWPSSGLYKLQNTDGSYTDENDSVWSEYHGEYINSEEAIYCPNAGDYVHADSAIYLEYKDIYASPNEETAYSEWFDQTYYLDDVVHSEIMSDYMPSDDSMIIVINSVGDEDFIPNNLSSDLFVKVIYKDGSETMTLNRYVILNPLDGKYYFRDEKIDGIKIEDYLSSKLEDIEVDKDKIKKYLLTTDFDLNKKKMDYIKSIYRIYLGMGLQNLEFLKKCIKYVLYAYPEKSIQKDGLPSLNYPDLRSQSNRMRRFKNSIINFDEEFLKQLLGEKSGALSEGGYDSIYNMVTLAQSFIKDVFTDPEIYKMWYKWKNT
jgi:hypothetical protein